MVVREQYIKKIQPFMDKPVVKVITGIRRSGKSELMKMLQAVLTERGVRQEQIVYINYESLRWEQYRDYRSLYNYVDEVRSKLNGQRIYVFVDEIQEVEEWERAVNSMIFILRVLTRDCCRRSLLLIWRDAMWSAWCTRCRMASF